MTEITLEFTDLDIEYMKEKFDIESDNDLISAVWECINTYMEL